MAIQFEVTEDKNDDIVFATDADGNDVIRAPLLNKGTALLRMNVTALVLTGLFPHVFFQLNNRWKRSISDIKDLEIYLPYAKLVTSWIKKMLIF